MPKYIELEKALQRFEEIKKSQISLNEAFYLDGVMMVLETIPAADVAPVVHGKWYFAEDCVFRCSVCDRICRELDAPYCYCGAKMALEDEGLCTTTLKSNT